METVPKLGILHEFTFEGETRPMVTFDSSALDRLQECAARSSEIHDPVFCLDETTGSVSAVFQVVTSTVVNALVLGAQLFLSCLANADVLTRIDPLETVSATLLEDYPLEYEGSLSYVEELKYAGGART